MRAADDHEEHARRRLAALGLTPPRWVPDQSGQHFPTDTEAAAPQDMAVVSGALTRRPAWLDEILVAASGKALASLAAVCVCCLVVTGWVLLRPRAAAAPPVAAPLPVAALPSPTPAGIVVDVGGRVRRPGLVTLPLGARVSDAVRAAGGAVRARDLALVNLAAKVSDGQLLLIGVPAADAAGAGVAGADAPVNLNTASVDQLDALPGIGPVLAQRIIDWRSAHGGFHTVRDLDQVSGIGDSIYAELAPLVTV